MSTSKTVTPSVRYKLDNLRTQQQTAKRERIGKYLVPFADLALECPHARGVKYDTKTGMLAFKYADRRVTYWLGAEKLMVFGISSNTYTVYNDFTADDFHTAIAYGNPDTTFKL